MTTSGGNTTEKVQYEIEVSTSGLQEIKQVNRRVN